MRSLAILIVYLLGFSQKKAWRSVQASLDKEPKTKATHSPQAPAPNLFFNVSSDTVELSDAHISTPLTPGEARYRETNIKVA